MILFSWIRDIVRQRLERTRYMRDWDKRIHVFFNESDLWLVQDSVKELWRVAWKDVIRIGFRTNNLGPFRDDYFLEFVADRGIPMKYAVSVGRTGSHELIEHVLAMDDTLVPKDTGILNNCTLNKSVTVWPSGLSGESMDLEDPEQYREQFRSSQRGKM